MRDKLIELLNSFLGGCEIKDMDMPDKCCKCQCMKKSEQRGGIYIGPHCGIKQRYISDISIHPEWCPMEEVKECI